MPMNQKERDLVKGLRKHQESCREQFLSEYTPFVEQDVRYHSKLGLIPKNKQEYATQRIINDFLMLVKESEKIPDGLSIRQMLHFLAVQVALELYLERGRSIPALRNHLWLQDMIYGGFFLPTVPPSRLFIERRFDKVGHLLLVEDDEPLTTRFLSSVLMPYIEAISAIQRVCNAVLERTHHEVAVISISQQSPTDIKLLDAAEAINAVKEDIIPWRRKNAQKLAELKQKEVAADIKKKEAEALEIRARSTKKKLSQKRLKPRSRR
jgi:hypothetical protein